MTEFFPGWLHEKEDLEFLHGTATPWKPPQTFHAPEEFDPRIFHRVENQKAQGACAGHGCTSVCEQCEYLVTGTVVQLCRQFSYITGQKADNLDGRDQGATISGVVKAAKNHGHCLESLWPYTGKYNTNIPRACYESAENHRIEHHAVLRSYDEILAFLKAGEGGVEIGVPWTSGLANNTSGRVTRSNSGGRNLGGHALAFLGWDKSGALWMVNSHSERWGDNGYALCDPEWVNDIFRQRFHEVIGMSQFSDNFGEAKTWDFVENNPFAGGNVA